MTNQIESVQDSHVAPNLHNFHHSADQEWQHQEPLIVFFIFFGLFFGGILRQVNQVTKIPYTPMLIILGIIFAIYRDDLGFIGDSIKIWSGINPHMILFIFIPVLIFESGFNCDWYVFKRALINIILLAAPGVFIGSIFLAVCLKVFLSYDDISWYGALTMGSILCATDPVAVVALLKELGASVQLNTLIEGESLLNDGTAMVFYQLFINLEKGKSSSPVDIFLGFCRTSLGGPLLGIFMGILGSYWIRRIIRDDVLTSTVTFIVCYICFYLAEFSFLAVSGILSIVVLGLFMSANGKTKIYPESEHAVHTVWSFAQYGCETLIFLLTGVLIGVEIVGQSTIVMSDWFKMFIFWIFMIIVRWLMIIILMPLLRKSGYPITRSEIYVIVWGGLRGALGLTLSLMVLVDQEIESIRLKQLTVFYMAGAATLTLLVNGTTCGALVNYLRIIEVTDVKKRLVQNSMRNMINVCNDKLKKLKSDQFLQLADWNKVEKISGLDELKTEMYRSQEGVNISQRKSTYAAINKKELLNEIRFRLLRSMKGLFWENYESGQLSANSVKLLDEVINIALDDTQNPLKLWDLIFINFTNLSYLQLMFTINNWIIIGIFKYFFQIKNNFQGSMAKTYITHHLSFVYEVVSCFIICAHEIEEIQNYLPLSKSYIEEVGEELQNSVKLAEHYIAELSDNFPQIIKSIHTKRAANGLIEAQKHFLRNYKTKGYIDDTDYVQFRKRIDSKAVNLENMQFDWVLPTFQSILLQFPIFSSLTDDQLKLLQQNQKVRTFETNEEIYTKGQPFRNIYVITQGTVDDKITDLFSITLGIGGFLSFANCVSETDEVSSSTAVAVTSVKTNCIPFSIIKQIMKQNRVFEQKMYMKSMIYFVRINPENAGPLKVLNENNLNDYCEHAEFFSLVQTQNITFEHGAYLIAGQIKDSSNGNVFKQFSYIYPSSNNHLALEDVYVIKFMGDIRHKVTVMDSTAEEKGYLKYQAENQEKQKSNVIEMQQMH
ncbi:sodium hydrogen exchanger family protein, putative [Ichthyophthirius multifiliis]|uniref:Sodium hydrogen exchanger family protein, putative n=1 Tax=Ichthyophthirius multifiliis TaxID=5932 RepID=G0R5U0_ICHMU|nr:sodium hydrogen exchanger family protein, putative [Ichthyophthirius multifiliis]EGR27161.1 sodium hydrogen exchanger family protein, putative [Ichthyophthirius multifiliis]|eukprot:XP_004024045.1 sodium hydrogen exchanger family protein, putative [Ichthyophthirius multifiliis]